MARKKPLAARIVVAFVTLTMAISGLFALAVVGVVRWIENDVVNAALEQQLGTAIAHYHEQGHWPSFVPGTDVYADGITAPIPADFAQAPDGFSEQASASDDFFVVQRRIEGRRFVLVHNQSEFEAQERLLYVGVASAWLAAVLLAWAIGHFTARRVMAPVADLARKVRTPPLNAAQPLVTEFADDEVGQLARAFDEALNAVRAALQRERLFTSDVSHELRTPLMVIASSAELLGVRTDDAYVKTQLTRINEAARDMDELVQTFLLLARSQGGHDFAGDKASVVSVARAQAAHWEPLLREKGLDFEWLCDGEPAGLYPAVLLRVVIGNLLRNAAHHTAQGRIVLRVDAAGVSVEDTGSGLPREVRAALFEPFVQGDVKRASGQGLGLGLSLVSRVAQAASWRITLDDRPEGGTHARIDMR
jgi:signal transduction histidine kinase